MLKDYYQLTEKFDTIIDFLRFGYTEATNADLFYGHGTDNAWDDIYWLIMASLSLPLEIDKHFLTAKLSPLEKSELIELLKKRIRDRVPVPYLINESLFCGLSFYVDERVLIPRSPIAELIAKQFSPWIEYESVHKILDLCTGSGCIAVACALAFPEAKIDAVDISPQALEVAEINRKRHGVETQLTLIQSDCWSNVPARHYDIIISNPPYVGVIEMSSLPKEFQHEPSLALKADGNGLAVVEKILVSAHQYLAEHGILIVEVGNSQEVVEEAYPNLPFVWLDFEQGGQGVFLLTYEQLNTYFG